MKYKNKQDANLDDTLDRKRSVHQDAKTVEDKVEVMKLKIG